MRRPPVALLGLTVALTGCSRAEVVSAGGVKLLVAAGTNGGSDVAVAGRLAVLDGGCLGSVEGDGHVLLAFPAGSTLAGGDPVGVRLRSGTVVHVGDTIFGGGGAEPPGGGLAPAIPEGCPRDDTVFVLASVQVR